MPQGAVETPFLTGVRTHGPLRPPKSKKIIKKKQNLATVGLELHKNVSQMSALPLRHIPFTAQMSNNNAPKFLQTIDNKEQNYKSIFVYNFKFLDFF